MRKVLVTQFLIGILISPSLFANDLQVSHQYKCKEEGNSKVTLLRIYVGGQTVATNYSTMQADSKVADKMNIYTGEVSRSFFGSNYAAMDIPVSMVEEKAEQATVLAHGYLETYRLSCEIMK